MNRSHLKCDLKFRIHFDIRRLWQCDEILHSNISGIYHTKGTLLCENIPYLYGTSKTFPSSSILWQNSPRVSEHFCYLLEFIFHTFLKKGCITRKFLKQNGIPEIFCISYRTIFRVRVATYFIWMLEIRRPRDIFSEKRHENLDSDCPDLIYQNSMGLSHAIFPRTKFLL